MSDQTPEQQPDLLQLSKPPAEFSADNHDMEETVGAGGAAGEESTPDAPWQTSAPKEDPPAAQTTEPDTDPPAATTPPETASNLRWDGYFLLLLVAVSLLRLGYLYLAPLDLSPEESSFWDWSRQLDFGYFNQFPLIIWTGALATKLFGVSTQAVRMPAVVFGAIGMLGLYLCGRRLYNGEIAFWAVAAWLASPGSAALGLFLAPEILLVSCWSLSLYTLWCASENPKAATHWWLATLLLIGLGSLAHPLMLVFPPLMILFLLFGRAGRTHLRQRWPWLVWGGSLLFLLPLLWWNLDHGWVNLQNNPLQLVIASLSPFARLKSLVGFAGGQMGLWTPISWMLLLVVTLFLLPGLFRWSAQTRYLFSFGGIGLLILSILSLNQSIDPNWATVFYPAGMLLLAAWAQGQINIMVIGPLRRWFLTGIKLGLILTLLAYSLPFVLQLSFLPLGKSDPTAPLKGWSELGRQIGNTLDQRARPRETFILSTLPQYSAELAFYTPGQPPVFLWPNDPAKISSQHDLRPAPVDKIGWDALIVQPADTPLPVDLAMVFENLIDQGEKSIPIGAAGERKYHLWRGENLLHWPEKY